MLATLALALNAGEKKESQDAVEGWNLTVLAGLSSFQDASKMISSFFEAPEPYQTTAKASCWNDDCQITRRLDYTWSK